MQMFAWRADVAAVARLWFHQQPEVNYLPRFSPQLISLERYTLSVYRTGGIEIFENLDIVHNRLLVGGKARPPSEAIFFFVY